ncbi:MAG: penicillin-binding protein 2 [Acidimicrobiales bacterium]
MNEALLGRRLGLLTFMAVALLGTLLARLYFLQVMEAPQFTAQAAENRTREIVTEAPRGLIYDTNGKVLAGRRESRVVTLDWTQLRDYNEEERAEIFTAVADEVNREGEKFKVDQLERRYQAARNGSLKPEPIAEDVSVRLWITLQERQFPGFNVERRYVRVYPYGSTGANIIGYIGNVGDTETADALNEKNDTKVYQPGDELGRAGIEALFESTLRGVPEIRRVEVDAQNRVIKEVEIIQEAVPGADVYLALDIDLQYAAERILVDELELARQRDACRGCRPHVADAGSLVAVDVRDGTVAALATYPNYDPSDFVFGMSSSQYQSLLDRPDTPLLDRTIKGLYPAGSTFKHVTGYAALVSGARGANDYWNDQGVFTINSCTSAEKSGCQFRNAGDAQYGYVNMAEAIEVSSDTYFYSLGEKFWVEQDTYGETIMQDVAAQFGFGTATGIQLPEERSGRVPTPENRMAEFGDDARWYTGDNINLSIGQGDLLVTPLQLADSYAVLASGGVRHQPRLVDRVVDPVSGETLIDFEPRVAGDEQFDVAALATIRDGLIRVPRTGTAAKAFEGFPLSEYPIAGKTGTAEVAKKADFALFAGYGPANDPQYAVAAVLEQAGFGGDAAAPAVRRFFELLGGFAPLPAAPLAGEPHVEFPRAPEIGSGEASSNADSEVVEDTPTTPTTEAVEPNPTTTTAAAPSTSTTSEPTPTTTTTAPTTEPSTEPPATEPAAPADAPTTGSSP